MMPSVAELLEALPDLERDDEAAPDRALLEQLVHELSVRAVPTGALRRLCSLGGLPARVALAYFVYYIRNWFRSDDRRQQQLLETHLRAAMQTLETMGYLRGAVMKVGQAIANFPDLVPDEFARLLGRLHFQAPPMHFGLLRELVFNELGADPDEVFAEFETTAFAAASIGQVHRARLRSGQTVAVKIQYPGIAHTIRADMRNLRALLFPLRLSPDWDSLQAQFEEVERVLERETDYEHEADCLRRARSAFQDEEHVVVPRVYDEYSTRRVLTMEYLPGDTLQQFLTGSPSQSRRDRFGNLVYRAASLLFARRRMYYSNFHPGNFLALPGERLGFLDFGCIRHLDDEEWGYMQHAHQVVLDRRPDVLRDYVQTSLLFSDAEMASRQEIVDLVERWAEYYWEPVRTPGAFDFGNPEYVRRGIDLWNNAARVRALRQRALNVYFHRGAFEQIGLFHQLRARIDCRKHYDEATRIAGWEAA